MHELSLCESIVDIIEQTAREQHFDTVRTVRLEVGALACVEIDALRFAFEVVTRHSCAEGARLDIETSPAQAWCFACGSEVALRSRIDPCPLCGSHQLQILAGDTLRILDLEVN